MFDLLLWTWIISAMVNMVYVMILFSKEEKTSDGSDEWFVAACLLLAPLTTLCILLMLLNKQPK